MKRKTCPKLILSLLLLMTVSSMPAKPEDCMPDLDEIYDIRRELNVHDVVPSIKTDELGFTLCEHCGSRILDREREESIRKFGYPFCFRCMADMYIEDAGIKDLIIQEKIRQEYTNRFWRGSK